MNELAIVAVTALGTLLIRLSMVTVMSEVQIPPRLQQALRLVAPAVLAGLVAQSLLLDDSEPSRLLGVSGLRQIGSWHVAAVIAAVAAWKSKSVGLTLGIGMSAVWIIGAVL